jgi:Cu+-exporting ATPase
MEVDEKRAKYSSEYSGATYYFCGQSCKSRFDANPHEFLNVSPTVSNRNYHPASTTDETLSVTNILHQASKIEDRASSTYTCPMHPEILRDKPGSCPICGMALELKSASAEEDRNPELVDMSRRFWTAAGLTIPLLASGMGEMLPLRLSEMFSMQTLDWIQLILATPVVLWCGLPFFERAWASILNRSLNMFTLIGLGVGTAYTYSVVAALFPDVFPITLRTAEGNVAVYF